MAKNAQIACAVSGFLAIFTFMLMGKIGGFMPPPPPMMPADQVAQFYAMKADHIQVAIIVQMCGLPLLLIFYAGLSAQIRRIETGVPVYAYISLAMGIMSVGLMFVGCFFWAAGAFRPDSSPEIIRMLNDVGIFALIAPSSPATVQLGAIGFAILGDRSASPLFPRWFGYFSLLAAVLVLPSIFVIMYKTGPFAWDGAWGNFGPMIGAVIWALLAQYFMIQIARRSHP
jgi:hypothetical protein